MTGDTFHLNHDQQRRYDLEQLKGLSVKEALEQLSEDYFMEIVVAVEEGCVWCAHPAGGPWEWLDVPPMAHDLDPAAALATLLALPALPSEVTQ